MSHLLGPRVRHPTSSWIWRLPSLVVVGSCGLEASAPVRTRTCWRPTASRLCCQLQEAAAGGAGLSSSRSLTTFSSAFSGVLVCCRNGALRSATLVTVIVMRMFRISFQEAQTHVTALWNIVDLNSVAPPSAHRMRPRRPLEFLLANGAWGLKGCQVVSPMPSNRPAWSWASRLQRLGRRRALRAGLWVPATPPSYVTCHVRNVNIAN